MNNTELHYLTYDPDEIWMEAMACYVDAGGDILYPGDEKEMLLRGVLAMTTQIFAAVDNALRMQTLRYAVGDYLNVLGEQRNCPRIEASAATAIVEITFRATGQAKTLRAGTAMTADGEKFYGLAEPLEQTGYEQTAICEVVCDQAGSEGNGLIAGTQMQLAITNPAVTRVIVKQDASGGNDAEDDETYRERIRVHGLASITTGPQAQYEAVAESVTSEILDARALNMGAGKVGIYLLLDSDTGAAAIMESVRSALNAQSVRPLTDSVEVYRAEDVPYTLNVQYAMDGSGNITAAISAAIREYQAWQDNTIGRAFNPDRLMAAIYQAGALRVMWGSGSTFNGGSVAYTPIDADQRCKGTITLAVING